MCSALCAAVRLQNTVNVIVSEWWPLATCCMDRAGVDVRAVHGLTAGDMRIGKHMDEDIHDHPINLHQACQRADCR